MVFFAYIGNQGAQNASQGNVFVTAIENIQDDEDLQNSNDLDKDYEVFAFDEW